MRVGPTGNERSPYVKRVTSPSKTVYGVGHDPGPLCLLNLCKDGSLLFLFPPYYLDTTHLLQDLLHCNFGLSLPTHS